MAQFPSSGGIYSLRCILLEPFWCKWLLVQMASGGMDMMSRDFYENILNPFLPKSTPRRQG